MREKLVRNFKFFVLSAKNGAERTSRVKIYLPAVAEKAIWQEKQRNVEYEARHWYMAKKRTESSGSLLIDNEQDAIHAALFGDNDNFRWIQKYSTPGIFIVVNG